MKNQGERLEISQTRGCSAGHSKRAGSHRVRREPQAVGEAHPEGYRTKRKRQPADGSKCNAGGHVSVPSVREEQGRDPRTPEDSQPQRGPPGKEELSAAGR